MNSGEGSVLKHRVSPINYKVFHDSVHGDISLHPLCVKIIDTPQFQRLRFVTQVGQVAFVYPTATHTRFDHCIGTCYLAGQFVNSLKINQPDLGISYEDVLCVEIAGLCHDLGHGPFSHLWERFMRNARPDFHWKHEVTTIEMLDHLFEVNNLQSEWDKYNLVKRDLIFIKELIAGPSNVEKEWPYKGRPRSKGFLYQIVANQINGIDVDKWDYCLRDGYHLGIKIMFEYGRLIKFSQVIEMTNGNFEICFREKEVDNLYDMFHMRKSLHRVAYKHRVSLTIGCMLNDAFLAADKHICFKGKDGTQLCLSEAVNDMVAYSQLTDSILMSIYTSQSSHPDMIKAKAIIHKIFTRSLFSFIGSTGPTDKISAADDVTREILAILPSTLSAKAEDFIVREVRINFGMGAENPMEKVRFYSKSNPSRPVMLHKEDVSSLLPHKFEEKMYFILTRREEEDFIKEASIAFTKLCTHFKFRRPSYDPHMENFTPDKSSYRRTKSETLC